MEMLSSRRPDNIAMIRLTSRERILKKTPIPHLANDKQLLAALITQLQHSNVRANAALDAALAAMKNTRTTIDAMRNYAPKSLD